MPPCFLPYIYTQTHTPPNWPLLQCFNILILMHKWDPTGSSTMGHTIALVEKRILARIRSRCWTGMSQYYPEIH